MPSTSAARRRASRERRRPPPRTADAERPRAGAGRTPRPPKARRATPAGGAAPAGVAHVEADRAEDRHELRVGPRARRAPARAGSGPRTRGAPSAGGAAASRSSRGAGATPIAVSATSPSTPGRRRPASAYPTGGWSSVSYARHQRSGVNGPWARLSHAQRPSRSGTPRSGHERRGTRRRSPRRHASSTSGRPSGGVSARSNASVRSRRARSRAAPGPRQAVAPAGVERRQVELDRLVGLAVAARWRPAGRRARGSSPSCHGCASRSVGSSRSGSGGHATTPPRDRARRRAAAVGAVGHEDPGAAGVAPRVAQPATLRCARPQASRWPTNAKERARNQGSSSGSGSGSRRRMLPPPVSCVPWPDPASSAAAPAVARSRPPASGTRPTPSRARGAVRHPRVRAARRVPRPLRRLRRARARGGLARLARDLRRPRARGHRGDPPQRPRPRARRRGPARRRAGRRARAARPVDVCSAAPPYPDDLPAIFQALLDSGCVRRAGATCSSTRPVAALASTHGAPPRRRRAALRLERPDDWVASRPPRRPTGASFDRPAGRRRGPG
jgi:hypothetical protein